MNQSSKSLNSENLTSIFAAIVVLVIFVGYLLPGDSLFSQALFSRQFADPVFLGLVIMAIFLKVRDAKSIVDPVYWLLLAGAFSAWFLLTLLRLFYWQELSPQAQSLLTNTAYFLFYALMTAAIEVKSYREARELLSGQSLLVLVSTFTFAVGAFVFLVLAPAPTIQQPIYLISADFSFYLLMDIYLTLRWLQLAWVCRKFYWVSYFLMALAMFNWAIADFVESLHVTNANQLNSGTWQDWLWYTPYLLVIAALKVRQSSSIEQNQNLTFSKSHLLNSPLFFVSLCFILYILINNTNEWFSPLSATQSTIFYLWFSLLLLLAIVQLNLFTEQLRHQQKIITDNRLETDVMKQRLLQQTESLKEQAASNKSILETTNNAIFTLNSDYVVQSCNPAACSILGLTKDDIIGQSFLQVTHAEGELSRYFNYKSYQRKLNVENDGIELESTICNSDNEHIPVHITLSKDINNHQGLMVVSVINISKQKKAEEEAHHLKDQFTANMSHEFRTPLTIINGVLDNLSNKNKYAEDIEQLNTAKRNSLRMIRMVDQLLDLSKIGHEPLPVEAIDIIPTIKFSCQSFEKMAIDRSLEFAVSISQSAWVEGNQNALEKILFNLLSNAFKYTQNGKISVTLNHLGGQYSLTVKDSGIGLETSQIESIFERFHRVDSAQTQAIQGVGIGLALVKELCDAMGWTIHVTSALNLGSTFNIVMPAAVPSSADNKAQVDRLTSDKNSQTLAEEIIRSQEFIKAEQNKKSKFSVLIVEDNHDMQAHIEAILSSHHQCLVASDGNEGLRLALDYLPDIIISDVMMPGIDGFELLKAIKNNELTTHIPVIMLTARSDDESKIKGLESEAEDYLSKPFNSKELLLRVNNQLNSRAKLQQKLASQWQADSSKIEATTEIEDQFVTKLNEIFETHYQDCEFSLQSMSKILAMSDRQVQRKVKSVLGLSPLEALKQFRLKQAKPMLDRGDQIGFVAQTCGFTSQSYFGRCFKETYKITPKAYQQSRAQQS
ncbi:response regulator [Aliikangiella marina]|uniref:response regulator n=1 Tax=Aliikangiella marina TaxID=1712262 RepID=UPI00163D8004|nr:response regulator [Aliikangiella marina]